MLGTAAFISLTHLLTNGHCHWNLVDLHDQRIFQAEALGSVYLMSDCSLQHFAADAKFAGLFHLMVFLFHDHQRLLIVSRCEDTSTLTFQLDFFRMQDKAVSADVDAAVMARRMPGFSGAELSNLVNEAALLAAKTGASSLTPKLLDQARDKVIMGVERRVGLTLLPDLHSVGPTSNLSRVTPGQTRSVTWSAADCVRPLALSMAARVWWTRLCRGRNCG